MEPGESSVGCLVGKVALITGASSGIGAATAVELARLGALLALTGRNEQNLNAVADKCSNQQHTGDWAGDQGHRPLVIVADTTVDDDAKRIVEKTVERFGRLDILVNSAGILGPGSIETTSMEFYDKVMNVNLRAVYHLTMLAVPHLIASGSGRIVNVSSVTGMRAFPNVITYCMSKAAMDQMTRCIALELASKGVRVNSVNPGVIVTEVHRRGGMDEESYAKFMEHSKTTHALGRVGQPEEVARAIAFLASDSSSFVTGVQLAVDGGRHAMCPR